MAPIPIRHQSMIFACITKLPIGMVIYPGMEGLIEYGLFDGNGDYHDRLAIKIVREATEAEYLAQGVNIDSRAMMARCKASNTRIYYYELQVD